MKNTTTIASATIFTAPTAYLIPTLNPTNRARWWRCQRSRRRQGMCALPCLVLSFQAPALLDTDSHGIAPNVRYLVTSISGTGTGLGAPPTGKTRCHTGSGAPPPSFAGPAGADRRQRFLRIDQGGLRLRECRGERRDRFTGAGDWHPPARKR